MKTMKESTTVKKIAFSILGLAVLMILSNNFLLASSNRLAQKQTIHEYVGFFNGIKGDTISLIKEKSYTISTYKLSPSIIVLNKDEPSDINSIIIHSIVKLLVVNGLVEKIVIMEVSS